MEKDATTIGEYIITQRSPHVVESHRDYCRRCKSYLVSLATLAHSSSRPAVTSRMTFRISS
jgi:hypothetical protein